MKRVLSIGAVLAVAILFLVLLRLTESNAPQFKRLQTPPFVQPSNHVSFDFLSPRPFEGGELWIHATSSRTNFESFLYDLNRRKVVGQLTRGWRVQALSDWKPMKERQFGVIERISRGRIKFTRPPRGPF
ncbi:MAG: hypothetical protein DME18_10340 [Verrucomicrobia bacterium]|nr:MAG: hypothetical protein DME18_10340 [Verrucomicrobiota bacterium]